MPATWCSTGRNPAIYPYSLDVGKVTSKQITANLAPNTRYYFVVKAYDNAWKLSPASNEVSTVTGVGHEPAGPAAATAAAAD